MGNQNAFLDPITASFIGAALGYRKKEISFVRRLRLGPLKLHVSPPYRDRNVDVHHHKGGDAHWATLSHIIL